MAWLRIQRYRHELVDCANPQCTCLRSPVAYACRSPRDQKGPMVTTESRRVLRSQAWWDDPANPEMTALYLERFLNFGLTRSELQSGRPIVGIAQTGSDLVPCNRHHVQLADRVRAGVRDAG